MKMVRKPTLTLAAGLVAVLVATLPGDAPALAEPAPPDWQPPDPPSVTDLPLTELAPTPRPVESNLD
ncbi:MAG: hypothetical protein ACRDT2_14060, partial [Natronosporangium sp.]